MNDDVKYMLYVMNEENCQVRSKHNCNTCSERIHCFDRIK